jgi:hypothetical protein
LTLQLLDFWEAIKWRAEGATTVQFIGFVAAGWL